MPKPINVLVTSSGRRCALCEIIKRATARHGGKLICADCDPLAPTLFMADKARRLPPFCDDGFLPELMAVIERDQVGLLVPTIDPGLALLAKHRAEIEAAGCHVLVSSPKCVEISQDKWQTYETFLAARVRTAHTWLPGNLSGPVPDRLFIKPRYGSGSRNAFEVHRRNLDPALALVPHPVVQECLVGSEFTIDALMDMNGKTLHYVPRRLLKAVGGEFVEGVTIDDADIRPWILDVLAVCTSLGARGPVTIQGFLTDSGPVLTEVNPRFAGGFPLAHAAGGLYPEWILDVMQGTCPNTELGEFRRGVYLSRCHKEMFVENLPWEIPTWTV